MYSALKSFIFGKAIRDKYEFPASSSFLTRKLRACARASYRYDVGNGIRSLARLVDSCKLFFDFRLLSAFDSFWRVIDKLNVINVFIKTILP